MKSTISHYRSLKAFKYLLYLKVKKDAYGILNKNTIVSHRKHNKTKNELM